jgi:hypothetical protein
MPLPLISIADTERDFKVSPQYRASEISGCRDTDNDTLSGQLSWSRALQLEPGAFYVRGHGYLDYGRLFRIEQEEARLAQSQPLHSSTDFEHLDR